MEVEQLKLQNSPAMTFDEVSMERSKSFVKALQVSLLLSHLPNSRSDLVLVQLSTILASFYLEYFSYLNNNVDC